MLQSSVTLHCVLVLFVCILDGRKATYIHTSMLIRTGGHGLFVLCMIFKCEYLHHFDCHINDAFVYNISGLIPAVQLQFPNCTHHGCFFHHCQAIWKRVQALGLQPAYSTDAEVRRYATYIHNQ